MPKKQRYQPPTPEQVLSTSTPTVKSLLSSYPCIFNLVPHWGDQDAFGHLNNVLYARYFETGRITYFQQILSFVSSPETVKPFSTAGGLGIILKSQHLNYKSPVFFPDQLTIGLRVPLESIDVDRFTMEFRMVSVNTEKVVCEGDAVVVMYDYKRHGKGELPVDALKGILAFEASVGRRDGAKAPFEMETALEGIVKRFEVQRQEKAVKKEVKKKDHGHGHGSSKL